VPYSSEITYFEVGSSVIANEVSALADPPGRKAISHLSVEIAMHLSGARNDTFIKRIYGYTA
jgi:hypothetical protein